MRSPKFSASFVAILVALLAISARAQQPSAGRTNISVKDPSGAGIPHAEIRLVPSADLPSKLETDNAGQLALDLKPGSYALFVTAQGFVNFRQRIEISAPVSDSSSPQLVPVMLRIGPGGSGPAVDNPKDALLLTADLYHQPVAIPPSEFRKLPHVTLKVHNAHFNTDATFEGVPLSTLLAMVNAPLGKDLHKEALVSYLIATGSDGYSVIFSLPEVDPAFHAGQIIVADKLNGKPLEYTGPFQLVVTDDNRPARWVYKLVSIALQTAP